MHGYFHHRVYYSHRKLVGDPGQYGTAVQLDGPSVHHDAPVFSYLQRAGILQWYRCAYLDRDGDEDGRIRGAELFRYDTPTHGVDDI
jgi:hypothetical protein